jgi:tight adherence protein C
MTDPLATSLPFAWAALVVAAIGLPRTPARRVLPRATTAVRPTPTTPPGPGWITHLGATVRRHATPRSLAGADVAADPQADRRTGWAALVSMVLLPLAPVLSPVPLAAAVALPVLATRAERRRQAAAVIDQLPDVVDLLALTTAAGLPVTAAVTAIAGRPGGPLGAAMSRAAGHVHHGGCLADALGHLARAGPPVRPLADALAHHDRYGSPLLPALERVGIEARSRRRRHAEEAARRLPVTLLFPLVLTTFPAFVALTVVPLLAGSLGSLSP